jgi:3' terminal RNA ribose 2'-O-methyltransferase Hen1
MLLNITTTYYPATDLGFLLHKHPDRFQSVDISYGKAHIFYPEKSADRTTISLLLDIDTVEMVRGVKQSGNFALEQYVNDRPYVTSSIMSVAIAKAFSSAMNGHCKERPELVNIPLPLEVYLPVVAAPKGGEMMILRLFEPLGYKVECSHCPLDTQFPEWGESKYYSVRLTHCITVKELLSHLYVLLPALDIGKHYFVSEAEVSKLLQKGEGWLDLHPEREVIINRYLIGLRSLARQAMEDLKISGFKDLKISELKDSKISESPESLNPEILKSLNLTRLNLVVQQLIASGAEKVLDLGCGDGKLIRLLLPEKQFSAITGIDVSYFELLRAKERLHYDEMSPAQQKRITLFQSSLTYRDKRLEGYDAAALVEVIEHIELDRLDIFAQAVFGCAHPGTVVITTPNKEYNVHYGLDESALRHSDHRFEWTRAEFNEWVISTGTKYGYQWNILPVGDVDEKTGASCQMAVLVRIRN